MLVSRLKIWINTILNLIILNKITAGKKENV